MIFCEGVSLIGFRSSLSHTSTRSTLEKTVHTDKAARFVIAVIASVHPGGPG